MRSLGNKRKEKYAPPPDVFGADAPDAVETELPEYRMEPDVPEPGRGRGKPKREKPPKPKRSKPPKPSGDFRRTAGDLLRSRVVIGFICVFVALAIAFIAVPVVQGMISERVPVVAVCADLERGTLLTADMLEITEIGVVDRPQNAAVSLDQVVGTFTRYDMLAGDLVLSGKLSRERPLSSPYLYDLPADKAAISVSVQGLAEGLSGKLKPGDIVTVYAVFNKSDAEEEYAAIQPPELKYVRVLATSNASGADIDVDDPGYSDPDARDTDRLPSTITMEAGAFQAAALAGLDHNAAIHVALAARATDTARCDSMLAAQEKYIAEKEAEAEEEAAAQQDSSVTSSLPPQPGESGTETDDGTTAAGGESEVSGPEAPVPVNG